jgi:isoleucyl-tRNA synthetase
MTSLEDHYDPEKVESNIKQKWSKENTYEAVKQMNEDNEDFYFLDGPPFTSGRMHCGTAWGKLLKDAFLRYYRMNGYNVLDRPGYDTHGLPIEVKVEKKNNFETKQDIVDYGVEKFIDECKEYVHNQKSVMDEEFADMGVWMDWDNPYLTMDPEYMNTVWSSFHELYEKGLVGRGFDVLNTCPRCETTLSDSELDYAHRTVRATYVEFPLTNMEGSVVAWTTTPWTVTGNQFVAVDKDSDYVRVDNDDLDEMYYVAENCVENLVEKLSWEDYTVKSNVKGAELVGEEYEHPLEGQMESLPRNRFRVQHADYVEAEKTGFVHSAPGYGHEDYERGEELGLEPYSPVNSNGQFSNQLPNYAGMYVHDEGAEKVMDDLSDKGHLLATERYTHEYPECPRCDTDVVFRATEQWFFKATEMKNGLQSAIDDTNWYPSDARDERFRNTVENAPDWNISRQRYWGTPLPVWVCEECGHDNVVESSEELEEKAKDDVEVNDMHRPNVDNVVVECSECTGDANRLEDVLDVWFDSSVASWGSLGSKPSEEASPDEWPSNLIVEGHDQTRGWFLMQLYLGVALADKAPYEDVLMHGFALLDSEPMSKSRGHVLRPPEVIEEHGRDAMRAYMLSNEEQESDVNMTSDMQGVSSMKKKLDVVWNVYRFAMMYMEEDDYIGTSDLQYGESDRKVLDKWVLSRLQSVSETVTEAFENREPSKALSVTLDFLVNDVSRYYVKTIRDRVWVTEHTKDKEVAYDTLFTVLYDGVKLLAPFTPYLSEELYINLPVEDRKFSVHSENWTERTGLYNESLEEEVESVRDVEEAVSHLRQQNGRKQRWPVTNVYVETNDDDLMSCLKSQSDLVKKRINTYNFYVGGEYPELEQVAEPDMSEFGPAFGRQANRVAEVVRDAKVRKLPVDVEIDGEEYHVDEDMVKTNELVPDSVDYTEFSGGRVFVDFELNDNVRLDGYTRDLVRRGQEMRSEMDLDMEETVYFSYKTDSEPVEKSLKDKRKYFKREVRVEEFVEKEDCYERTWNVNGDSVLFRMKRSE